MTTLLRFKLQCSSHEASEKTQNGKKTFSGFNIIHHLYIAFNSFVKIEYF